MALAALTLGLCAVPGLAFAQDDDPDGGGVEEPCTSVICEGGVPAEDDPYGGGLEDPYGGRPLDPGDTACDDASDGCQADGGEGSIENVSGEGTAGADTDADAAIEGGGTGGSLSGRSSSNGGESDGGSVTSLDDVSSVRSVTLARTGVDAWVAAALGALSLAGRLALLVVTRRARLAA